MKIEEVHETLKTVNALLTREEIETLHKYAKEVPADQNIIDIGTAAGTSSLTMALAGKSDVYTIDPNRNENFIRKVEELELTEKIYFIEKTSEKAAVDVPVNVGLLFIDGIHNYLGVMDDFGWYSDKVVKGGYIIFHDYFLYGNTIGKAVDDIVESGAVEKVEIIDSTFRKDVRTGMYVSRKL
jgi:predicted O-methyltransferase YrrM